MKMLKERRYFLLMCQLGTLGTLVAWSNIFGLDYSFYERFAWWDIISHMLGGLWVGLFVAWSTSYFGKRITVLEAVTSAVVVGIGWEVYEYIVGLQYTTNPWPIQIEIAKDLLDDAIGGLLAGYFVNKFRR
jgi:hypothetical protein